jgi:hypothetical protein
LYAPSRYRIDEHGVVALVLVGVDLGEGRDGAIERPGRAAMSAEIFESQS